MSLKFLEGSTELGVTPLDSTMIIGYKFWGIRRQRKFRFETTLKRGTAVKRVPAAVRETLPPPGGREVLSISENGKNLSTLL